MKYFSHAQWPEGPSPGPDGSHTSKDNHPSEEAAKSVCRMLEAHGMGGEGIIFPIKTWTTCEREKTDLPEPKAISLQSCMDDLNSIKTMRIEEVKIIAKIAHDRLARFKGATRLKEEERIREVFHACQRRIRRI